MRKTIGIIFIICAVIVYGICGLWGLYIDLVVVNEVAGFWGIVIGLTILPMTFLAVPVYVLIKWGSWFPLLLNYGGLVVGGILYAIGSWIKKD
ncbi:MAG TPA: hypothetical protein PLX02_01240 [Syntrophorhabdaceae bacterium]|nr:hypothetical protein [Syntrophorhabdaceae bacterium]HQM80221.1 hypothetical protein [Syntrophorhabdaceae bacterium]